MNFWPHFIPVDHFKCFTLKSSNLFLLNRGSKTASKAQHSRDDAWILTVGKKFQKISAKLFEEFSCRNKKYLRCFRFPVFGAVCSFYFFLSDGCDANKTWAPTARYLEIWHSAFLPHNNRALSQWENNLNWWHALIPKHGITKFWHKPIDSGISEPLKRICENISSTKISNLRCTSLFQHLLMSMFPQNQTNLAWVSNKNPSCPNKNQWFWCFLQRLTGVLNPETSFVQWQWYDEKALLHVVILLDMLSRDNLDTLNPPTSSCFVLSFSIDGELTIGPLPVQRLVWQSMCCRGRLQESSPYLPQPDSTGRWLRTLIFPDLFFFYHSDCKTAWGVASSNKIYCTTRLTAARRRAFFPISLSNMGYFKCPMSLPAKTVCRVHLH